MSKKRDSLLYKKDITNLEDAIDYIDKLKNRIVKIQKRNRELESENKTYRKVWVKTENYTEEISAGKPLSELIKTAKGDGKLKKNGDSCPKCPQGAIKKIIFSGFHIIICSNCDFKDRIDEFIVKEDK